MSAVSSFALCIDCWEMHYAIPDKNGVFTRDSPSSNHHDHAVHVFGIPNDYPNPIRNVLAALSAGLPITDAQMWLFSLACALHAIQPNNGVKVTLTTTTTETPQTPERELPTPTLEPLFEAPT